MASREQSTLDWAARRRALLDAAGDDYDALREAYDRAWKAAYCDAFRKVARERGWIEEHIESGWLDDLPGEALIADSHRDPAEVAAEDVIECEIEAANA